MGKTGHKIKILFFGTPEIAAQHLETCLKEPSYQIVGVVTQPDQPSGRGQKLTPPAVKTLVSGAPDVKLFQPQQLKTQEFIEEIKALNADLGVSVAYGRLMPEALIKTPKYHCINVHFSALPKLRGPSPVESTILEGLPQAGCTVFWIDKDMDSGPILLQETLPVLSGETAPQLYERLRPIGVKLLHQAIKLIAQERAPRVTQQHDLATYCKIIKKKDGLINWHEDAGMIERKIRAFIKWPKATTNLFGRKLHLLEATPWPKAGYDGAIGDIVHLEKGQGFVVKCAQGSLLIRKVKPEGKRAMPAWSFVQGLHLK